MEALLFDKRSGEFKFSTNVPIPEIELDNDVIIRVSHSGICGTDLHILEGAFPCNDRRPYILGHEFCGEVVSAGPKAAFKPGQRVAVDPNKGCYVCTLCHSGLYSLCDRHKDNVGIWRDGGWAQFCKVPDTQVFEIPDEITYSEGALCEPLSCLVRGWDRAGPMPIGSDILILGAGIIGNLWSILFHLQGHKNVTVSEPNANRLSTSKGMGLGYKYGTPDEIMASGKQYDVIVDCTGVAKVMTVSIKLLKRAGRYVIFGCCNPKDTAEINPFEMYAKEATIIAVNVNPFTFPKAISLLQAMGDRYLNYEKLGIGVFSMKDYQVAFDQLKKGAISKAVFKIC